MPMLVHDMSNKVSRQSGRLHGRILPRHRRHSHAGLGCRDHLQYQLDVDWNVPVITISSSKVP
eukprot:4673846-Amphidinium_carterae.1